MNILIIGYGSIGNKHFRLLKNNFKNINLYILSKRKINVKGAIIISSLIEIKNINPDYVIISSETHNHYQQLRFLEKNFKKIKILIEKPIFEKFKNISIKNNRVFVGYNLRFHPAVSFLKKFISKNLPIDIKILTNSYLPSWRKRNYLNNYAVNTKRGGGVILDLSHEIDLALWLFGKIKISYLRFGKISNLKIKSEDYLNFLGKIKKANFYLDLNYYSKNEVRQIFVDTQKKSIFLDLKKNIIKVNSKKINLFKKKYKVDDTYLDMHKSIIFNKKHSYLCSYLDAIKVLKIFRKIKRFQTKKFYA